MRIVIETIPGDQQPYPTVGYWEFGNGELRIDVTDTGNDDFNCLILVHELIEALLCAEQGITTEQVDEFDMAFERERKQGDKSEPGDDPKAPYRIQHKQAEAIELLMASFLKVDWREYEAALNKL